METAQYLKIICEEIHSVVVATLDQEGHPVTRVIDMMLHDDSSLYFLTAKGKEFYRQLMDQKYLSLSGMSGGEGSMSKKAVSVHGNVRNIGKEKLDEIFEKNPYMWEIYPTRESQKALTVFQIHEGSGEWFDLSKQPIERASFVIDNKQDEIEVYEITNKCNGCKACQTVCPQGCIDFSTVPAVIREKNCLHCGNCFTVCPKEAIVHRG